MASRRARQRSAATNMGNCQYLREPKATNDVKHRQRKVNQNGGGDSLGQAVLKEVVETAGDGPRSIRNEVPECTQATRKGRKRPRISADTTSRSQPVAKRGPGVKPIQEATKRVPKTKCAQGSASAMAESNRRLKPFACAKPRTGPVTTENTPVSMSFQETTVLYLNPEDVSVKRREGGQLEVFGKGEHGYVVRGEYNPPGGAEAAEVVVKYVKNGRSDLDEVTHDARMLAYLSDTGCVPKVYGLLKGKAKKEEPAIVQECVGGGFRLKDVLRLKAAQSTWVKLCLQSAEGLQKIHAKRALLNDIKPDNMLVDCSRVGNNVQFIDMGTASHKYGICFRCDPSMARSHHLAPEVRRGGLTSELSDIYSLGKVIEDIGKKARNAQLYIIGQLMTSENPYQRCSLQSVIKLLKDVANRLT